MLKGRGDNRALNSLWQAVGVEARPPTQPPGTGLPLPSGAQSSHPDQGSSRSLGQELLLLPDTCMLCWGSLSIMPASLSCPHIFLRAPRCQHLYKRSLAWGTAHQRVRAGGRSMHHTPNTKLVASNSSPFDTRAIHPHPPSHHPDAY